MEQIQHRVSCGHMRSCILPGGWRNLILTWIPSNDSHNFITRFSFLDDIFLLSSLELYLRADNVNQDTCLSHQKMSTQNHHCSQKRSWPCYQPCYHRGSKFCVCPVLVIHATKQPDFCPESFPPRKQPYWGWGGGQDSFLEACKSSGWQFSF